MLKTEFRDGVLGFGVVAKTYFSRTTLLNFEYFNDALSYDVIVLCLALKSEINLLSAGTSFYHV